MRSAILIYLAAQRLWNMEGGSEGIDVAEDFASDMMSGECFAALQQVLKLGTYFPLLRASLKVLGSRTTELICTQYGLKVQKCPTFF